MPARRGSAKGAGRGARKKRAAEPASRGLTATQLVAGSPPTNLESLRRAIEEDGGSVLAVYRDPLGGNWQLLAGLPLEKVQPTPFQRDLSETHVARLSDVIGRLDRFLDPVIAIRTEEGLYWTPNGHHRSAALRQIGCRSIVALVLAEPEVAYRILALNTEKAHNLREKSLEVVRMARSLSEQDRRAEKDYLLEFEEAAFSPSGSATRSVESSPVAPTIRCSGGWMILSKPRCRRPSRSARSGPRGFWSSTTRSRRPSML